MSWKQELIFDELPTEGLSRKIAQAIGVENLVSLAEIVGGTTCYLPKAEILLRPVRDRYVKEDFNGNNHLQLAIKYNISERWVREICGPGVDEGQISFDDLSK